MNIKPETRIIDLQLASPETVLAEAFYILDAEAVWRDQCSSLTVSQLTELSSLTHERVVKRLERISRLSRGVSIENSLIEKWITSHVAFTVVSVDGMFPPYAQSASEQINKWDNSFASFVEKHLESQSNVICCAKTFSPAFSAAMFLRGAGFKNAFAAKLT